jgi:hypothetical protein
MVESFGTSEMDLMVAGLGVELLALAIFPVDIVVCLKSNK